MSVVGSWCESSGIASVVDSESDRWLTAYRDNAQGSVHSLAVLFSLCSWEVKEGTGEGHYAFQSPLKGLSLVVAQAEDQVFNMWVFRV